jgi:hypothetical protein
LTPQNPDVFSSIRIAVAASQSAAWTPPLPVTASESMFASPAAVVASRRMLFQPAVRLTVRLTVVQLVHTPVDGKSTVATLAPLIFTLPGRAVEPLAKRHSN